MDEKVKLSLEMVKKDPTPERKKLLAGYLSNKQISPDLKNEIRTFLGQAPQNLQGLKNEVQETSNFYKFTNPRDISYEEVKLFIQANDNPQIVGTHLDIKQYFIDTGIQHGKTININAFSGSKHEATQSAQNIAGWINHLHVVFNVDPRHNVAVGIVGAEAVRRIIQSSAPINENFINRQAPQGVNPVTKKKPKKESIAKKPTDTKPHKASETPSGQPVEKLKESSEAILKLAGLNYKEIFTFISKEIGFNGKVFNEDFKNKLLTYQEKNKLENNGIISETLIFSITSKQVVDIKNLTKLITGKVGEEVVSTLLPLSKNNKEFTNFQKATQDGSVTQKQKDIFSSILNSSNPIHQKINYAIAKSLSEEYKIKNPNDVQFNTKVTEASKKNADAYMASPEVKGVMDTPTADGRDIGEIIADPNIGGWEKFSTILNSGAGASALLILGAVFLFTDKIMGGSIWKKIGILAIVAVAYATGKEDTMKILKGAFKGKDKPKPATTAATQDGNTAKQQLTQAKTNPSPTPSSESSSWKEALKVGPAKDDDYDVFSEVTGTIIGNQGAKNAFKGVENKDDTIKGVYGHLQINHELRKTSISAVSSYASSDSDTSLDELFGTFTDGNIKLEGADGKSYTVSKVQLKYILKVIIESKSDYLQEDKEMSEIFEGNGFNTDTAIDKTKEWFKSFTAAETATGAAGLVAMKLFSKTWVGRAFILGLTAIGVDNVEDAGEIKEDLLKWFDSTIGKEFGTKREKLVQKLSENVQKALSEGKDEGELVNDTSTSDADKEILRKVIVTDFSNSIGAASSLQGEKSTAQLNIINENITKSPLTDAQKLVLVNLVKQKVKLNKLKELETQVKKELKKVEEAQNNLKKAQDNFNTSETELKRLKSKLETAKEEKKNAKTSDQRDTAKKKISELSAAIPILEANISASEKHVEKKKIELANKQVQDFIPQAKEISNYILTDIQESMEDPEVGVLQTFANWNKEINSKLSVLNEMRKTLDISNNETEKDKLEKIVDSIDEKLDQYISKIEEAFTQISDTLISPTSFDMNSESYKTNKAILKGGKYNDTYLNIKKYLERGNIGLDSSNIIEGYKTEGLNQAIIIEGKSKSDTKKQEDINKIIEVLNTLKIDTSKIQEVLVRITKKSADAKAKAEKEADDAKAKSAKKDAEKVSTNKKTKPTKPGKAPRTDEAVIDDPSKNSKKSITPVAAETINKPEHINAKLLKDIPKLKGAWEKIEKVSKDSLNAKQLATLKATYNNTINATTLLELGELLDNIDAVDNSSGKQTILRNIEVLLKIK